MVRRSRLLVPLLLAVAVLVVGVIAFSALRSGNETSAPAKQAAAGSALSGEAKDARQAIVDYFFAFADQDAGRACELLTEPGQRKLVQRLRSKSRDCEKALKRRLASTPKAELEGLRQVEVTDVKAAGGTATARINVVDRSGRVALQKVDGQWQLNAGKAANQPAEAPRR